MHAKKHIGNLKEAVQQQPLASMIMKQSNFVELKQN